MDTYSTVADSPSQLQTSTVPLDVWIEVSRELDGIDVLRLSQVSSFLHDGLSERSIWVDVLRTTCKKYQLFERSYPTHQMDLLHLQRVCLGPFLWASLIKRHAVSIENITPSCPPIQPVSSLSMGCAGAGCTSLLLPGGRFLLVLGSKTPSHLPTGNIFLRIWDLGVPGASVLPAPTQIGEMDTGLPHSFHLGMKFEAGTMGSAISTIVVYCSPFEFNDQCWIAVFNADFQSFDTGVRISRRTEVKLLGRRHYWRILSLYQGRLLLSSGDLSFVWDLPCNTWVYTGLVNDPKREHEVTILFDGQLHGMVGVPTGFVHLCKLSDCTTFPFDPEEFPPDMSDDHYTSSSHPLQISRPFANGGFTSGDGRSPSRGLPVFWDIAKGANDEPGALWCDSMTRYAFNPVNAGGQGHVGKITCQPFLQVVFQGHKQIQFDWSTERETFSSLFFSSTQLYFYHYGDAPDPSPLQCIYSVIPSDAPQERLDNLERVVGGAIEAVHEESRDFFVGEASYDTPCAATLMLTPLSAKWAFSQSCICSGRLVHVNDERGFTVTDYLW